MSVIISYRKPGQPRPSFVTLDRIKGTLLGRVKEMSFSIWNPDKDWRDENNHYSYTPETTDIAKIVADITELYNKAA